MGLPNPAACWGTNLVGSSERQLDFRLCAAKVGSWGLNSTHSCKHAA